MIYRLVCYIIDILAIPAFLFKFFSSHIQFDLSCLKIYYDLVITEGYEILQRKNLVCFVYILPRLFYCEHGSVPLWTNLSHALYVWIQLKRKIVHFDNEHTMHNYGQGYLVPLCKFTITATANSELKVAFLDSRQERYFYISLEYFRPCSEVVWNSHSYFLVCPRMFQLGSAFSLRPDKITTQSESKYRVCILKKRKEKKNTHHHQRRLHHKMSQNWNWKKHKVSPKF